MTKEDLLKGTKAHVGKFNKTVQEKLQALGITWRTGDTEIKYTDTSFLTIDEKGYAFTDSLEIFTNYKKKEVTINDILSIETPKKEKTKKLKLGQKVLVRDSDNEKWILDFFEIKEDDGKFQCVDASWSQCIPLKGNRHLHYTTNNQ